MDSHRIIYYIYTHIGTYPYLRHASNGALWHAPSRVEDHQSSWVSRPIYDNRPRLQVKSSHGASTASHYNIIHDGYTYVYIYIYTRSEHIIIQRDAYDIPMHCCYYNL
jgi:hypothetical protein